MEQILNLVKQAKASTKELIRLSTNEKNDALLAIAKALVDDNKKILDANAMDVKAARDNGMSEALVDRLILTKERIIAMADAVVELSKLDDPIGNVEHLKKRPNGLMIGSMCVPLGVVAIIYESRPNVTCDAATLCIKTGNAVVLRGGKEAINSNIAIISVIKQAAYKAGLPEGCIGLVTDTSREGASFLMKQHEYVDVLIPRGGAKLIKSVVENSTIPTIQTGVGNCHIFIEKTADIDMAINILINAKTQRLGVCNACESLLIDIAIEKQEIIKICEALKENGVEIRGCNRLHTIFPDTIIATEEDYSTEFLDKIISVKIIDSFNEAVDHIAKYSTGHSECIVTNDYNLSNMFLKIVDSAAVYVNASTRFTDGSVFGFGAEMGISTQKLHARGPMGIMALTSSKYVIYGEGQIR